MSGDLTSKEKRIKMNKEDESDAARQEQEQRDRERKDRIQKALERFHELSKRIKRTPWGRR